MGRIKNSILLLLSIGGLAVGLAAGRYGAGEVAVQAWMASTAAVLAGLLLQIGQSLLHRSFSVDLIALLAIAVALVLGQYLAGAVIAVMFAGGGALEEFSRAKARRELSALLGRAPKIAHRHEADRLVDIPADLAQPNDRLIVKAGEAVPTDGVIASGTAVLDEAALTGESIPVTRTSGDPVRSGAINAGAPFEVTVLSAARDSTYAAIVRLVQTAQEGKAPLIRLADRYALWFVPFTLAAAGLAYALSQDPLRLLAVLVVATPCPLILAAPVAIICGISRAARRGVLIKTGGALETLARARVLLMHKTGTLTTGQARVVGIEVDPSQDAAEVVRLAASLDQVSHHVMAATLVDAARARGIPLSMATAVTEYAGAGIAGRVDGKEVLVGSYDWVNGRAGPAPWARRTFRRAVHEGMVGIFVAVDGRLAGALLVADEIRPESPRTLRALRAAGIMKIVMLSGDHQEVAESVAGALGIDAVLAQRSPQEKVDAVRRERREAVTIMVGDGVNDAPSLAAADVGVALGARGGGASAEAADVVLMVDRLDRLAEGLGIARWARRIAIQSVLIGMGLSVVAMGFAAFGFLKPVAGAVLQEGIDVLVILNALRALAPIGAAAAARPLTESKARELRDEHRELAGLIDRIQAAADHLDTIPPAEAKGELFEIRDLLRSRLLPHEREDDRVLYPRLASMLGGRDPMASMSRTHGEIVHRSRLFGRMVDDLGADGPDAEDIREIRRNLYGLGAILKLHFAQEEEVFHSLS